MIDLPDRPPPLSADIKRRRIRSFGLAILIVAAIEALPWVTWRWL